MSGVVGDLACAVTPGLCGAADAVGGAIGDAASSVVAQTFEYIYEQIASLLGTALAAAVAGWLFIPIPALADVDSNSGVGFIQSRVFFFTVLLVIVSFIISGVRIVWQMRAEPARRLLQEMLTLVAVTAAGTTAVGLLVTTLDTFAVWVVAESLAVDDSQVGQAMGERLLDLFMLGTAVTGAPGLGFIATSVMMFLAVLASIIQIVLLFLRTAMLVLLVGILPLSYALFALQIGKDWFRKVLGWLIAFMLYKPAAGLVYALGFTLFAGNPGDSLSEVETFFNMMLGITILVMSILVLPALLRLVAPMVSPMAGGGGGLAAGAAIGAAAVPAGAVLLSSRFGGGGGGSAPAAGGGSPNGAGGPRGAQPQGAGPRPAVPASAPAGAGAGAAGGAAAGGAGAGAAGGAAAAAGPVGAGAAVLSTVGTAGAQAVDGARRAAGEATGGDQ